MPDAADVIADIQARLNELEVTSPDTALSVAEQLLGLMEQAVEVLENKEGLKAVRSFISGLTRQITEWQKHSAYRTPDAHHLRGLRMYKQCFSGHLSTG